MTVTGLVRAAVERRLITLMLAAMLVAVAITVLLGLPRNVDPPIPIPTTIVTIEMPGADAAELEEFVAKPIENALQGLERVEEIESRSADGLAIVYVGFTNGTDVEQALDRTVREVQSLRAQLPSGIASIGFRRPGTSEAAVMLFALVSKDADALRFSKYALDLRDVLQVVPGARRVTVDGAPSPAIEIGFDMRRMIEHRVSPETLAAAIRAQGAIAPVGAVGIGDNRLTLDAGRGFRDLESIRRLPVVGSEGQIVRVQDLAEVTWSDAEPRQLTRFNGERAIFVSVRPLEGLDAISLRKRLVAAADRFKSKLPPDIRLETGFDQSRDIERKLDQLTKDFAIALALVLITIFPLGLRSALLVAVSIPMSLAGGLMLLGVLGFGLDQISISGLILSLGLLVDDAIVVVESIARRRAAGMEMTEAAVAGTTAVAIPAMGASLILCLAFLPLAFLPAESGDFVRGLPVAVIATVLCSLLVALTVIPCLAARQGQAAHGAGPSTLEVIMAWIERLYHPLLSSALRAPRRWFAATMLLCVGSLGLFPVLGFSLFPYADAPYFLVRVQTPDSTSLAATDQAVRKVAERIAKAPGVTDHLESAGRGNPQIYYNVSQREVNKSFGEIMVTLNTSAPQQIAKIVDGIRTAVSGMPGVRTSVVKFRNGPFIEAPIAIRVRGPELAEIQRISRKVSEILTRAQGTYDVFDPLANEQTNLRVEIDEDRARTLGIAPGAVKVAMRLALSGETVSQLRDSEGDVWPVVLRLPVTGFRDVSALAQTFVYNRMGEPIPLSAVTRQTLTGSPTAISRYKLERANVVTADLKPGVLASDIQRQIGPQLNRLSLPDGYQIIQAGEQESTENSFKGFAPIVLFAALGILVILVLEFGSLREAMVVAGVIPLGLVGGTVALFLSGNSLSFLAIIGFVALVGVEIKNSILFVDLAAQLRQQGATLRESIEQASITRFLPVLMTSVTAIGGLLPLALSDSALYSPLAWVMIGGLVSSTLIGRLAIPVMYLLALKGKEGPQASQHRGAA